MTSNPDVALIASRLKRARDRMTPRTNQDEAARAIGVSPSTLQKWEQGVNSPPTVHLAALAQLYECTADYLCGLTPECPDKRDTVLLDESLLKEVRAALAAGDRQKVEDTLLWDPPMFLAWIRVPREGRFLSEREAQRERRHLVFEIEEAYPDLVSHWRRRFGSG